MSLNQVHVNNTAISATGRFALYIEGANCAFTTIQVMTEDGVIPRMAITVPATPSMREMSRRVRVHLLFREYVKDEWVVLFEGEILTRGFQKTPTGRDLTFMVYHVTQHLGEYTISALDPGVAIANAMSGAELSNPGLGALRGNILSLFHPNAIASELKEAGFKVSPDALTFAHFVKGAFLRYRKVLDASRIKNSYPYRATIFHRLFDRIQTPDPALIDWDKFYTILMGEIFTQNAIQEGGRISFYELIRMVAQHFLHQVTVIPNAESYTKQVQIKPQTVFNVVPRCNIIYSSMTNQYAFQENFAEKPTRIEGKFYPIGTTPGQDAGPIARYLTVYGPSELQWRWLQIGEALLKGRTTQGAKADQKDDGSLTMIGPKDGIPFLTREEDQRGIVPLYYDIPRTLNAAIMALVQKPPVEGEDSPIASTPPDEAPTKAFLALKSDEEDDRIVKYRAFLCMALGSGRGIDPGRFKGGVGKDYYKLGQKLLLMSIPENLRKFNDIPKIVPQRITYAAYKVYPSYNEGKSRKIANRQALLSTGANYFIGKDGTIIQVLPRHMHLFAEPRALPYGITIQGLNYQDAMEINYTMPPYGVSRDDANDSDKFLGVIRGSRTWPTGSSDIPPPPVPDANGYVDAIAFSAADRVSGAAMELDKHFNKIRAKVDDVSTKAVGTTQFFGGVKIIEKRTDGTNFYFKFDRPVIKVGADTVLRVMSPSSLERDASTFRPWVVMGENSPTPAVGRKPQAIAKSRLQKINDPIQSKDQLALGNDLNCVIGFEYQESGLTDEQVKAAGFLTAAIKELSAKKAGTSKSKTPSAAQRELQIQDANVRAAIEYFGQNEGQFIDIRRWLPNIKSETSKWQDKFYGDFSTWDDELRRGEFKPLAPESIDGTEPPDSSVPHEVSTLDQRKAATASANLSDEVAKVNDVIEEKRMDKFIDFYAAAIINFQFYYQRFANQMFDAPLVFNPYLITGYPCLLLDDSDAKYHLLAYVHAVTHVITPDSAQTMVTYTHVRNARHEKIVPYRKVQKQYFPVMLSNQTKYDVSDPESRKGYYAELDKLGLSVNAFLPVEMLGIGKKSGERPAPPFIYHGGFGLGTKKEFNFSTYARFVGYVNDDNSLPQTYLDNFVFSDDKELSFSTDGQDDGVEGDDASGALAQEQDIDTVQALRKVYRRIQKVGQNNIKKSQASLVAFDEKTSSKDSKLAPDYIKVYSMPPGVDPSNKDGKTLDWDARIQKKVITHTKQVEQKTAIRG